MQNKGTYTLHRLFPTLNEGELAKLQEHSSIITLRRGKNLFVSGDSPRSVYGVANGCLKVVRENAEGESIILHIVGSGEVLGLHEVFTASSYTRTAVALRDTEIFALDSRAVLELVNNNPGLSMQFIHKLSAEISAMEQRLEGNMFRSARSRVSRVLYDLYHGFAEEGQNNFEPPLSRRDVAEMADVAPETVSRVLADLKTAGILESQGPMFRVLDLNGLVMEAEVHQ